ncbi:hypothetical protein PFISCL1PPCAC_14472, partial [Pristionchus fissidentatus]
VSPSMRRAFRCIFIVMIFDVGGWATSIALLHFTIAMDFTDETHIVMIYVTGLFVNFGLAVKASIYYINSMEYRQAFVDVLGLPGMRMPMQSTSTVTDLT